MSLQNAPMPHPFPIDVQKHYLTPPSEGATFWVSEASDLHFRIGCWPTLLVVDGWPEGRELLHHKKVLYEGEVHVYEGMHHELHVLND